MQTQTETTLTLPQRIHAPKKGRPVLWSPLTDTLYPIPKKPFLLGKADGAQIRLEHPTVSRSHATGSYSAPWLTLTDTNSRNGLRRGGRRLTSTKITYNQVISLGSLPLVLLPGAPTAQRGGPIVTREPQFRQLLEDIGRVAHGDLTIMIGGESGTGKELVAQLIHENSSRRGEPFFTLNCGAIPKDLVESELFGHARGAFSGASQRREGVLAMAHRGTLFLDEIGELRPEHQSALLRFLETGYYRSVGADIHSRADVRIVTATHKNLREEVTQGGFRLDLLFRLSQLSFTLPPLRERLMDIPLLMDHFGAPSPPAHVLGELLEAPFEGNVRELKNLCEVAHSFGWEKTWRQFHGEEPLGTTCEEEEEARPLYEAVQLKAITEALGSARGNVSAAARILGIPRTTLINKMRRSGLR